MILSFSQWLNELAHLAQNNYEPFTINGKEATIIDMKFENYPPVLKAVLMHQNAKFYGKIEEGYLTFDGHDLTVTSEKPSGYIKLPEDWFDYALIVYADGSVKQPSKGEK